MTLLNKKYNILIIQMGKKTKKKTTHRNCNESYICPNDKICNTRSGRCVRKNSKLLDYNISKPKNNTKKVKKRNCNKGYICSTDKVCDTRRGICIRTNSKLLDNVKLTLEKTKYKKNNKIQINGIMKIMSFNILADCWVNWYRDKGSYYWKFNLPDDSYPDKIITDHRKEWINILDKETRRPIILDIIRSAMSKDYIIYLQELEVDDKKYDLGKINLSESELTVHKNTYISELCKKMGYRIFYGWNKRTGTWAQNGCAICISNIFIDGTEIVRQIPVVNESSGATALILEIIKGKYQYIFVSSHMDRGTQPEHISNIIDKIIDITKSDTIIIWCGDFNMDSIKIKNIFNDFYHINGIKEIDTDSDFKTQYLRKSENFTDAIRADHILSNVPGSYDLIQMSDYTNDIYNNINEEYLAKDTLKNYGSDHKPEYANIQIPI